MSPVSARGTIQATGNQPGGFLESAGPGPGSDPNRQTTADSRVHSTHKVRPSAGREGAPPQEEPSGSPSLSIKRLQAQVVETDLELLFKSCRAGHTGE